MTSLQSSQQESIRNDNWEIDNAKVIKLMPNSPPILDLLLYSFTFLYINVDYIIVVDTVKFFYLCRMLKEISVLKKCRIVR